MSSLKASGASGAGGGGKATHQVTHALQLDFAQATRIVVYGMAGAMAIAFIVSLVAMPGGKAEEPVGEAEVPAAAGPAAQPGVVA